jgi:hypothetical protein
MKSETSLSSPITRAVRRRFLSVGRACPRSVATHIGLSISPGSVAAHGVAEAAAPPAVGIRGRAVLDAADAADPTGSVGGKVVVPTRTRASNTKAGNQPSQKTMSTMKEPISNQRAR